MSKLETTVCNIDEFGRDLSLKTKQYNFNSIFCDYFDHLRGLSWAEINWLLEEEEEAEQTKKESEKRLAEREELRQTLVERKKLHEAGLYELEEGEELEF